MLVTSVKNVKSGRFSAFSKKKSLCTVYIYHIVVCKTEEIHFTSPISVTCRNIVITNQFYSHDYYLPGAKIMLLNHLPT